MPRVPYDLPSVGEHSTPTSPLSARGVAPPVDATGRQLQNLGAATLQAGAATTSIGLQLQGQIDDAKLLRMDALLSDKDRKVVSGYQNQLGQDAIDGKQAAVDQLLTTRKQIADTLDNDVQREIFAKHAEQRREIASGLIETHFQQQVHADAIGGLTARIKTSIIDASNFDGKYAQTLPVPTAAGMQDPAQGQGIPDRAGGTDMSRAGVYIPIPAPKVAPGALYENTAVHDTNLLADRLGLPLAEPQRRLKVLDTLTQIHELRINRFISEGRSDIARTYLANLPADEVDPHVRSQLQLRVRDASTKSDGASAAATAIDAATKSLPAPEEGGYLSPVLVAGKAREEIERQRAAGTMPVEVADNATARIDKKQDEWARVQAELAHTAVKQATDWLSANKTLGIEAMPTELAAEVTRAGPQFVAAVDSWAEHGRYTTDQTVFQAFKSVSDDTLRDLTPAQLFTQYLVHFGPSEQAYAASKWEMARGNAQHSGLVTSRNQTDFSLAVHGFISPPGVSPAPVVTAAQVLHAERLRMEIATRAGVFKQNDLGGKRDLNPTELQTVIDGVLLDVVRLPGSFLGISWSDQTKLATDLTAQELATAFVSIDPEKMKAPVNAGGYNVLVPAGNIRLREVPADWNKYLTVGLHRRGLPVTQQAIIEKWVALGKPHTVAPPIR